MESTDNSWIFENLEIEGSCAYIKSKPDAPGRENALSGERWPLSPFVEMNNFLKIPGLVISSKNTHRSRFQCRLSVLTRGSASLRLDWK